MTKYWHPKQQCDECGRIRHNQMLLRKYKPTKVGPNTIKELQEKYEREKKVDGNLAS